MLGHPGYAQIAEAFRALGASVIVAGSASFVDGTLQAESFAAAVQELATAIKPESAVDEDVPLNRRERRAAAAMRRRGRPFRRENMHDHRGSA